MIQRPRKSFEVSDLRLTTSSYTKQSETDWCVGTGPCDFSCHQHIGDSKTRQLTVRVDNREFLSLMAAVK